MLIKLLYCNNRAFEHIFCMEGGEFEKSNYGKLKFLGSAPGGGGTGVGMLNIKLTNFKEVLLIPLIPSLY